MNRIDLFVENWGGKKAMVPVNTHDIEALESDLNISFPKSYTYLISTYGLVHSPNVLTQVCHLNSDISVVQDFLSLEDIGSLSKLYELTGMPKGHVLFASDSKGNMFCFSPSDCANKREDSAVWLFNHAQCSVKKISDSFIGWLESFNEL